MDSVTIIRIVAGLIAVVFFVVYIFYILSLYRALSKCSVSSRTIQPGTVWLLLVPLVNLVWQFFVVIGLAKSLGNELRARGIPSAEPEPGKSIGIAMCVCAACGIIPLVNVLTLPANLVLWIIYWAKIAGFSWRLDQVPATYVALPYAPQGLPPGMPLIPPGTGQSRPLHRHHPQWVPRGLFPSLFGFSWGWLVSSPSPLSSCSLPFPPLA